MHRFTKATAVAVVGLLALSACGSDDEQADTTSAPTTEPAAETTAAPPVTDAPTTTVAQASYSVEASNGTVTLDAQPMAIVSLSPTHTEMLFAIGAGDQVIAVDDMSNYPAEAAAVSSALSGYTPNVEAIAGYEPDLVVIGDDFTGLTEQLAAVDIPVWSGASAATLEDVYAQLEQLGVLTGHIAEAAAVVAEVTTGVEAALGELEELPEPLTYYHELDDQLFSITSNTFLGQLYTMVGLRNIADGAESDSPYPQLNNEFIISKDPQLIFLADSKCCAQTPETVAARDGWAEISAVTNGGVVTMDDDIASRWGPRVVDYLEAIVAAVNAVALAPAG